jgi:hypothetical protein
MKLFQQATALYALEMQLNIMIAFYLRTMVTNENCIHDEFREILATI